MTPKPTISVITVTLNAAAALPALIESLRRQTDREFTWVIFDGGSTDETVDLARTSGVADVRLKVGQDFGIYDALNQCLAGVTTDYYLVCGADDLLYPEAVALYRKAAADSGADVISAAVDIDDWVLRPRDGKGWLLGMPGIASSHSVGSLIRRSLHDKLGPYSRRFPIAADQLFIKTAHSSGALFHRASFVAGRYGTSGTSGTDMAGMLTEAFRVQRLTERNRLVQVVLFVARLFKHYRRL